MRQRLEGCRHKLRDRQGPQKLEEAGKALRQSLGGVSPGHTLISGHRDQANECWSKSARVRSPAGRPRPLTQGESQGGGRALLTPSAPTSVQMRGPPWVPQGPVVSPGSWDSQHPAQAWLDPSRGSTEMPSEEQAGCRPDGTHRPPCESSLGGPALTPCPGPPASTSAQMQWALWQPTRTSSSAVPSTTSELGDPCGFSQQAHEPRPHLLAREPLG